MAASRDHKGIKVTQRGVCLITNVKLFPHFWHHWRLVAHHLHLCGVRLAHGGEVVQQLCEDQDGAVMDGQEDEVRLESPRTSCGCLQMTLRSAARAGKQEERSEGEQEAERGERGGRGR